MKCQEFLERVEERAHLNSRDESLDAIRAVLETLGERAVPEDKRADSLPPDGTNAFADVAGERVIERLSAEEFQARVAQRGCSDEGVAALCVQAVLETLAEALEEGKPSASGSSDQRSENSAEASLKESSADSPPVVDLEV